MAGSTSAANTRSRGACTTLVTLSFTARQRALEGPPRVHLRQMRAELRRGVDVAERLDAVGRVRGRGGNRRRARTALPGQRLLDRGRAVRLRRDAGDADADAVVADNRRRRRDSAKPLAFCSVFT